MSLLNALIQTHEGSDMFLSYFIKQTHFMSQTLYHQHRRCAHVTRPRSTPWRMLNLSVTILLQELRTNKRRPEWSCYWSQDLLLSDETSERNNNTMTSSCLRTCSSSKDQTNSTHGEITPSKTTCLKLIWRLCVKTCCCAAWRRMKSIKDRRTRRRVWGWNNNCEAVLCTSVLDMCGWR